jgi:DNA polymerase-3 subunit alpha
VPLHHSCRTPWWSCEPACVVLTGETIASFKQVLGEHPGRTPVHLRLIGPEDVKVMRLDDNLRIDHSSALVADLKELLGPQCLG